MLCINPFLDLGTADVFSRSVACLFISQQVINEYRSLNLVKSVLAFFFSFQLIPFVSCR